MSNIRPLPAHPSIEFDRKEAKALLKQLHAGDTGALQRASAHVARSADNTEHSRTLADAQRIIARSYGFPSWPRLVDYFTSLERHRHVATKGRLTAAGRRNRPDLIAMGAVFEHVPLRHDADDFEIMWEAFRFAGWNHRWHTIDTLLEAGLPIDHAPFGMPVTVPSSAAHRLAMQA